MKIVIGGQIDKKVIEQLVQLCSSEIIEVTIQSDLQAAMAIKTGEADYYLGACYTGGGGAIAMAIAILGSEMCVTVSTPGRRPDKNSIEKAITQGKKAFGFTTDHKEEAVPLIIGAITDKFNKTGVIN